MIRDDLSIFIHREILPIYDSFESGHDRRHAENVIAAAGGYAQKYDLDEEILFVAAAYHDLGLRIDRAAHHAHSADILQRDGRLRAWFDEAQIAVMAQAVRDHRASAKEKPASLYGKALADADREYDAERILERTLAFEFAKFPDMDSERQIARAREHISEKYGESGYMSFYLPNEDAERKREEILSLLASDAKFRELAEKLLRNMRKPLSVSAYLSRIGIDSPLELSYQSLREMQSRHLRSVPYENMDILRDIPLSQDYRALYDKIVTKQRGGYCFELNELFGWLLRAQGYHVTDCFARFLKDEPQIPMRRHHVLIVQVPGDDARYLCDVGVGSGSPTYPVLIREGAVDDQGDAAWKLTFDPFLGWILSQQKRGAWEKIFSFTEEKQLAVDFLAASYYCEYSPDSPFNKAPMISLRTEDGRVTLDGNELRHFTKDGVSVCKVDDVQAACREYFGIVL